MDEQEAQKGVNVPEEVSLGVGADNDRAKVIASDKEHADFFKKFGEPDSFHFFAKVGSDSAFATRVVRDLLYKEEGGYAPPEDIQAPQEDNIVGKLDHTGDVATKQHVEGESEAPATSTVE